MKGHSRLIEKNILRKGQSITLSSGRLSLAATQRNNGRLPTANGNDAGNDRPSLIVYQFSTLNSEKEETRKNTAKFSGPLTWKEKKEEN